MRRSAFHRKKNVNKTKKRGELSKDEIKRILHFKVKTTMNFIDE
jgi:hypothetical protein